MAYGIGYLHWKSNHIFSNVDSGDGIGTPNPIGMGLDSQGMNLTGLERIELEFSSASITGRCYTEMLTTRRLTHRREDRPSAIGQHPSCSGCARYIVFFYVFFRCPARNLGRQFKKKPPYCGSGFQTPLELQITTFLSELEIISLRIGVKIRKM